MSLFPPPTLTPNACGAAEIASHRASYGLALGSDRVDQIGVMQPIFFHGVVRETLNEVDRRRLVFETLSVRLHWDIALNSVELSGDRLAERHRYHSRETWCAAN